MGRLGAFNSSNLQVCSYFSVSYFLNYCVVIALLDGLRFEYWLGMLRKRNISHTSLFGRKLWVIYLYLLLQEEIFCMHSIFLGKSFGKISS